MKKLFGFILALSIGYYSIAQSNSTTIPPALGMAGDNLNLYLVLNLFKQATSIEDFERLLNNSDNGVNNLDLNNDGYIDYLRVTDYGKDDYHTIVIQDIISASEVQDIAIINLQKKDGNVVHVQIIGDESLYGKNYIIEPQLDNTASITQPAPTTVINNNYYTNNNYYKRNESPFYNAWSWPCVSFIFGPAYTPWVSPWHWTYYPTWWYARPVVIYTSYIGHFHDFGWNYYHRSHLTINRVRYDSYYDSHRVMSKTVQGNISKGSYKYDYGNMQIDRNPRANKVNNSPRYGNNNWGGNNKDAKSKQNSQNNSKWQNNNGNVNSTYKNKDNNNNNWGGLNNSSEPKQSNTSNKSKWNNNNTGNDDTYKSRDNKNKNWGGINNNNTNTNTNTSPTPKNRDKWGGNDYKSNSSTPSGNYNGSNKESKPEGTYNSGGKSGSWNSNGGGNRGSGNFNSGGNKSGGNNGGHIRINSRGK